MKLIDAIKQKGRPFTVHDCSRDELPEFFKQMGYKVGAEIGVYHGEFTKKFCEGGLAMYAIDPWMAYLGAGRTENVQEKQDINFEEAKKNLSTYPNCKMIRKISMEALNDFKNESLDFVYIDGDHKFRFIAEDISEWEKKVRHGGVISGHDYFNTNPRATNVICHVGAIVDAFAKIKDWDFYVFGDSDRTLSWMFLKK